MNVLVTGATGFIGGRLVPSLLEGMTNEVVVTDDRIEGLVPVELTPIEDAISAALEDQTGWGDVSLEAPEPGAE
ncbi:NAD-dependent epimerase/dehydratase family protein [Natrononativus amylolyticus]|uniref:NAD-dependent epimerase/dehydratase family protein n=1 Tax=Natrononativus amylolyticus TaxID=2963434 RepID=UPI0020CDD913|nr:NAD-dependent epimerase/dehydratase family protein [Natrononativus amylolyticus]